MIRLFAPLLVLLAACSPKKENPESHHEEKPRNDSPKNKTELQFTVPAAWKPKENASKLRLATYSVPDKAKQAKDAEFVIFYFGASGGGSIDANIDRWIGQFEGATRENTKIEKLHGIFEATVVEISGTYDAETQPGSGERVFEPDSRMLAAILETDMGSHFFKLVGPAATVGGWTDEFRTLLSKAFIPHEK